MYAQLGSLIIDGLTSFTDFNRKLAWTYSDHPLMDTKPRTQRIGTDLTTLSVSFHFHRAICDVEASIDALSDAADAGSIMPLVMGNGRYLGDFVITDMSEVHKQGDKQGNIVDATVEVNLKEYFVPGNAQIIEQQAISQGLAVLSSSPNPIRSLRVQAPDDVQACSQALQLANTGNNMVTQASFQVSLFPAQGGALAGLALNGVSNCVTGLTSMSSLINASTYLQSAGSPGLAGIIASTLTFIAANKQILTTPSAGDISSFSSGLMLEMNQVNNASLGIQQAVILRQNENS